MEWDEIMKCLLVLPLVASCSTFSEPPGFEHAMADSVYSCEGTKEFYYVKGNTDIMKFRCIEDK